MDSICRRAGALGQPEQSDSDACLRSLLSSRDLYSQEPKNLVPYDERKLKVAKGDLRPKCAAHFLTGEAAVLYKHAEQHIVRPECEMEDIRQTSDPIRPYWDPRLAKSREERWRLFRRLWEIGPIGLCRAIKARVGIFFVRKKSPDEIRMVIDARQA